MKIRIIGSLVAVFVVNQISLADTDGSNHVQIITNPSTPKKITKKPVVKTNSKKVVTKKVTKPIGPRQAAIVRSVPVPKTVAIIPVTNRYRIPGKRVSLANSGSARANSYTSGEASTPLFISPVTPNLSTSVKQAEKQAGENPWGFQIKSYNAIDLNALENSGTTRDYTIRAWERIYFSYNFNSDISLILMPQFYHTWFEDQNRSQSTTNPGLNQSYAAYLGDTALTLKDTKIFDLGDGVAISGFQSYFAPTSETAQTAGELGETRTNLGIGKSFGKLDLKWSEEFRYYLQQYETNTFLSATGTPIANVAYRLLSYGDIGYNFTKNFGVALEAGVANESYYADSFNGAPAGYNNYIIMNPAIAYTLGHFNLEFGIWEVFNSSAGSSSQPANQTYTPFTPLNSEGVGQMAGSEVYLQGTLKF